MQPLISVEVADPGGLGPIARPTGIVIITGWLANFADSAKAFGALLASDRAGRISLYTPAR